MKFGQALDLLNTGKEVQRVNATSKIALNRDINGKPHFIAEKQKGDDVNLKMWEPTHADLLADDWQVAEF